MRLSSSLQLLIFLLSFTLSANLLAQRVEHVQGDLLIQLKPETDGERWLQSWNRLQPQSLRIDKIEMISQPADIWLLKFNHAEIEERNLLLAVQQAPTVLVAQYNHTVKLRDMPDDLRFGEQWQYDNTGQTGGTIDADIDAVEAWDVTTGGTTLAGDTIVVAVLDNGIDVNHPDFQRNRWYNHAEIPGNGIDDDNNGYVDDYRGWSTVSNNDNIMGGSHGTAVSGIVGADGDNAMGVTGVNWYVKVMHIRNNFNTNEAKVLEAYSYAWEQRLAYNSSGGSEGAFVVATNASWGVDEGQPEDAPLWCNFYDIMGQAGIISCGATINEDLDVDADGDLPTACPSDYLIAVTNTDHNDLKVQLAGYGATTIDLAAPGAGAFNITNGGNYAGFGGTSGATPHVAGTIALLYSMDCPTLVALTESDPSAAGLMVRQAILESVDPLANLQDITVTGGRLNVNNAVQYMLGLCDGCIPATSVQTNNITVTSATISWNINDSLQSVDIRYRPVGTDDWTLFEDASSPLQLTDLQGCQEYEFQVQSNCLSGTIPFGNSRFFETDGCCTAPENIVIEVVSGSQVNFAWTSVTAATSYDLRYRINGVPDWTVVNTLTNSVSLTDLETCTVYQFQTRTNCVGESTPWSNLDGFLSGECGPCLDLEYCQPIDVLNNDEEFIAQVEIGGFFTNSSGANDGSYADFGQNIEAFDLEAGTVYPVLLTPGYTGGSAFDETWRIWLDADHNGSFTSNEIIFDAEASNMPRDGFMTIPPGANLGITRMRVMMRFSSTAEACPFLMGFGEVEDYCVNILPPSVCPAPEGFELTPLSFTEVDIAWDPVTQALDFDADYRAADDVDWTPINVTNFAVTLSELDSCTNYVFRIRSLCNGDDSDFSQFEFDTCDGPSSTRDLTTRTAYWTIAPNPAQSFFSVHLTENVPNEDLTVVVHNAFGQRLMQTQWPRGQKQLSLYETEKLAAGMYTVSLYHKQQLWSSKRVVKQ